jgi:endonuclease/exonuclease/phosphatase family metal-dependent hydrolase
VLAALLVGAFLDDLAAAADRTIRGRRLIVSNPKPGDPSARRVIATGHEPRGAEPVTGDPTLPLGFGGAVLELVANGASPSWQTFGLAQGTSASGGPYWRPVAPSGYRYADPNGEQGPVRSVLVAQGGHGALRVRAVVRGRGGRLDIVPPNPGTDGLLAISLSRADRTCVQYGAEGVSRNRGDRRWAIRRIRDEGCGTPPQATGEFLALSYNVAGLPEGISGSHPERNTPLISPLLNGYDLVVVQESWQTPDPNPLAPLRVYHELLVAEADHPYKTVSAPLPLGSDPRRPSALVSDGLNMLSRFPFTSLVREMWSGCWPSAADCLSQKGFMTARTTFAPGVTIDVYDLHMEAGGDPEDDELRDQAVTQLADFMQVFSSGRPVIVGGDFNLHTDTEPDSTQFQRLLAATGLTDVCAALACPEPGRIDKFLFRSSAGLELTPLSWRFETDVFITPEGEPLSDHDPLAVRFRWAVRE